MVCGSGKTLKINKLLILSARPTAPYKILYFCTVSTFLIFLTPLKTALDLKLKG